MPIAGAIDVGGRRLDVRGLGWFDREWGTSALPPGVVGWDWLALQLDDGRDVMVYRLRNADGSLAPASLATIIDASGATARFGADAFRLAPRGRWVSPATGVAYPASVELTIPAAGLALTVTPAVPDQEAALSVRYWEGAVVASGRAPAAVHGRGYLELTGYASHAPPPP
jgi:predicted secreted hydrolase